MKPNYIVKHLGAFTLLTLILLVGGWIRIQGVPRIPEGQFTSTDAYLYYRQADIITKHGTLPARDMHRWVLLGRDLGQTLNVYSYATASAYKLITLFFPNITLYQVHLFAPVVCFLLGLGVLCLFLYRTFGLSIAATVGLLLAIMPGSVERSAAGFSDRDSWCWLLGLKSIDVDFSWPVTVTAKLKTGEEVLLPYIAVDRKGEIERNPYMENRNGGILHYFEDQENTLYYIPPIGWNSLAIKLFFRNIETPHFIPVYPQKEFPTAKVKVWEIHYPSDIKAHPKYLATDPKD